MYKLPKTILLISPDLWSACKVSKHHYARFLAAKGHKVYFLEPYRGGAARCEEVEARLHTLYVPARYFGLSWYPSFLARYCMRKEWKYLEDLTGEHFEMVWSFDSSRFFYLDALPVSIKLVQIMDLTENFQLRKMCAHADLCLAASKPIYERLSSYNKHVRYIGHGYSGNGSGASAHVLEQIAVISRFFAHCVGYAGNLDIPYIDWALVLQLVREHKDVGFVFFGSYGANLSSTYVRELKHMGNAFFMGQQAPDALHTYLEAMDMLLLLYKAAKYAAQLAHPHKILTYLGTGKMVLATWTEDYKNKRDIVYMSADSRTLSAQMTTLLAEKSIHNSPKNQIMRRQYAESHSYDKKLQQIAFDLSKKSKNTAPKTGTHA